MYKSDVVYLQEQKMCKAISPQVIGGILFEREYMVHLEGERTELAQAVEIALNEIVREGMYNVSATKV